MQYNSADTDLMGTTHHTVVRGDARDLSFIPSESVHLVVTSPPYWTLKRYTDEAGQLGHISEYEEFLSELKKVWQECYRILVPGGRMVCVVGDVLLSRRSFGRHWVVPLHADIAVQCRYIGFDNLNPIIWYKIANATYEVNNGGSFLGKPYEPNAIIKSDIEYILMQRKAGGYRSPTEQQRDLSRISKDDYGKWFRQIWEIGGSSTREHPAPFPLEVAKRLVRMFSFWGDTVVDPFSGSGTTMLAAMETGRNSIGIEISRDYCKNAYSRLGRANSTLFSNKTILFEDRLTAPRGNDEKLHVVIQK